MTTKCRQKSHMITLLQNVDILGLTLKDHQIKHYQFKYVKVQTFQISILFKYFFNSIIRKFVKFLILILSM